MELKCDNNEHRIPHELRPLFRQIADAFAARDYSLKTRTINCVTLADSSTESFITDCVEAYGDTITGLDEATWEQSCYTSATNHWIALVDLATAQEPVSDLTLHARIFLDPELRIVVDSVHVP